MTKMIITGVATFLLGIGLTALVLTNPFQWEWMHRFGHAVMDPVAEGTGELWTCGMHPQVLQDGPGTCPICHMDLVPVEPPEGVADLASTEPESERKIKYWQAPMDPTYIRNEPGKSPMGMDLIPVYEDEGGDEEFVAGAIRIDPVFVQNIGVQSEPVQRTDIPFTIRTVGTLTYDDGQIAWVNTKYEGWIENVYVNYVGEPVEKGQKLFDIYSPQLVTTQKEYLQALDYAERMEGSQYPDIAKRARSLLAASRERLSYWDISEAQIESLESTRELRRTLAVVAPVSGVVVEKMDQALDGMFVQAGMNLYKIVDLSSIWLEAKVYENQVPWLRVGSRAEIELPYEPGRTYTGRIRYLYPFFDEKTRTMKVSVELPNPGGRLRADMYAKVTFDVPAARNVLAAPEEAVIHSGERNVIVIDLGNGTFQAKEVTLGVNGGGLWEVKEGLEDGDRVVISAQFLIDSESTLKEAIRKLVARERESTASDDDVEAETSPMPGHVH